MPKPWRASSCLILLLLSLFAASSAPATVSTAAPSPVAPAAVGPLRPATISVLSHTDFIPDATGVYAHRSRQGRDKTPPFGADNDQHTGSDQAYDQLERKHGYDPEAVGLPELLADVILEQLAKSNRFLPVERKALRTAVLEQRFGQQLQKSYLDRTLDKAIAEMDSFEVGAGLAMPSTVSGAKYNDLLHDFKDLATSVGADYLVLGNLHQLGSSVQNITVPLSERNRTVRKKTAKARLRLRVIQASSGTVLGAASLQLQVPAILLNGSPEEGEDFAFMEDLGQQAARQILDIIFPAKVVSLDPLIISRGSNDGIRVGDRFGLIREGKTIKESSGVVIGHLKQVLGRVEVITVQETLAVVQALEGADFRRGDLAALELQSPSPQVPAPQNASVPLQSSSTLGVQGRPRVAVGLVKCGSTAKTGCSSAHIPIFTDTIITRLVQSKRFTVIDRQEVDQLLDEQTAQALAANRNLPSAMGSLKGCDYLLIGSLQNFSQEEQNFQLPNSSRVMKMLAGHAEGNIRLVDARSGDIMESRKISLSRQLEIQAGAARLTAALADAFADQVVANLLNAVYPVKVAAVAPDGTIYINRGSDGRLTKGDRLEILRPGQRITDPDTGVELGTMETRMGELQLSQVEANRSLATILEGEAVQAGDLLKPVSATSKETASTSPARSGGLLPISSSAAPQKPGRQAEMFVRATLALTSLQLNARQTFKDSAMISALQQGTMDQLSDTLADALDKTHRFTLMERRQIDRLLDEKAFQAIARGADIRPYLAELSGADYLVLGELTNFYLHLRKEKVPYLDEYELSSTGFIEGNLRIADSHSSAIVATEKIRIKQFYTNLGVEEIRTRLIDQFVTAAAAGIIQRIYPIKVLAAMADGTIYLNRGADAGIQEGTTFAVERPGPPLIDPDTGLSFGSAETTIGFLEVTAVEEARSRARMIDGGQTAAGDILRRRAPARVKAVEKMQVAW
ncbi:CsgG/HfaB family protein [Desulfogranum mediterraneum]|uniref:CsgG/HfaB family protein n=1 Tax=Desulfogranum mediterraneum TaxID=160661 RepID=UPI00040EDC6C|nr:CsgG/HfaB family protein [Desulfogranum mediterraneum]